MNCVILLGSSTSEMKQSSTGHAALGKSCGGTWSEWVVRLFDGCLVRSVMLLSRSCFVNFLKSASQDKVQNRSHFDTTSSVFIF